jgi:hypothetical protein
VESWLHNNHWEIIVTSKFVALMIMSHWFRISFYQMKSVRLLLKELLNWPDHRAIVVSFFCLISFLSLAGLKYPDQNISYFYSHMTSFFSLILFFGIEFVIITSIEYILPKDHKFSFGILGAIYSLFFIFSTRLCIPDYYELFPYIVFCFSTLIVLSGKSFKNWSNIACFLLFFIAPMGAFFGLDPVWGNDFSPFSLKSKIALPFLLIIWVVSFTYYNYRNQIISGTKKLLS